MSNTDDQLVNPGEEAAAGESSPQETPTPSPEASTENAGESPSSAGKGEQFVPVSHLIEQRRRRVEAEKKVREYEGMMSGIQEERRLFDDARPEIMQLLQEKERLAEERQAMADELEALRGIEKLAEERGIELPNSDHLRLQQLIKTMNSKLKQIDSLPQTMNQQLEMLQRKQNEQNERMRAELLQREAAIKAEAAFDSQWDSLMEVSPELGLDEDLREITMARWRKSGGQKSVQEFFKPVLAAAKADKAKAQAKRQETLGLAPAPAVSAGQTGAPRAKSGEQPTTWNQFWSSLEKSR